MRIRISLIVALVALAACSGGVERPARRTYNEGVALVAAKSWEEAETKLLEARSEAGVDPELRWRAAYQLGAAFAGHAEELASAEPPELARALELYGKAAAWFQDAARLRPDDKTAPENLEIVRLRQQAIADRLGEGERALEARLDKLIEGQRKLRDDARELVEAARAGGAANPAALAEAAGALAVSERVLLADAGVVVDLAGLEIDGIGAKAEDERSDEEKVRLVQLQNLDLWMQVARSAVSDARRMLDETRVDDAHGRADDAIDGLKRAREQLLDPIAVLRLIAADELAVAQQTEYLDQANAQKAKLGAAASEAPAMPIPAWLTTAQLGARQRDARSRLDELAARLKAAVEGFDAQQATPPAPDAPPDPEAAQQARLMAVVKEALPDVDAAAAAMLRAQDALGASNTGDALTAQREALEALARVIERFLDIKSLVDTTWKEQQAVVALLGDPAALPPQIAAMAPAERSRQAGESVARNLRRLERLDGLLQDAALELDAQLAQAQQQQPDAAQQAQQQAEGERQRIARAGELRAQALAQLRELDAGGKRPPLEVASEALATIDELRKLYFSLIEHLEELIRQQGETRDRTTEAHGLDDVGRAPLLGGLSQRQTEHQATATEIGEALAQQADQLAQQPAQPGQPDAAEQARKVGEAAEEVRAAVAAMAPAIDTFAKAQTAQQSVDLAPVLDDQQKAIEHLTAALRLLQPPQQQQDQQDPQQQQDQQQQDQQQQQQQQQDQQEQSAERRRERVREQEAQRRREREQRQRAGDDPVERDW